MDSPDFVGTQAKDVDAHRTLVRKGELSFGVFLGFCTGYLIKKVGKLFALMVGASFIFLQVCLYYGSLKRELTYSSVFVAQRIHYHPLGSFGRGLQPTTRR